MFKKYLSVPIMNNNIIQPFIVREADLVVNERAKIHAMDPSVEDHSIYFPHFDIHIELFLHILFPFFPTYKPSLAPIEGTDEIYLITTEGICNPGSDAYMKSKILSFIRKNTSQRIDTGSKLC